MRRAERARMKLCCSSAAFADAINAGRLTQLEWIDICSNELDVDGIEFDGPYFPRTDDDYLAQLKKLCVDRCLTVASLHVPLEFGGADVDASISAFLPWIDHALALGSPLVRFACAAVPEGSPGIAWRELVRGLKSICVEAKRRNVTLALERGDEGTLVVSPGDVRRALKECDSAWLRVAMRADDLVSPLTPEWLNLLGETTFAIVNSADPGLRAPLSRSGYRGFVALCFSGGPAELDAVQAAIASWRDAR